MGWLCYGQVNGVTGGGTIIRELLGVKLVTGDLNIIILILGLNFFSFFLIPPYAPACENDEASETRLRK